MITRERLGSGSSCTRGCPPSLASLLLSGVEPAFSVAFTPDGQTLAAGGFDGTIRVWPRVALHRTPAGTAVGSRQVWVWSAVDRGAATRKTPQFSANGNT